MALLIVILISWLVERNPAEYVKFDMFGLIYRSFFLLIGQSINCLID